LTEVAAVVAIVMVYLIMLEIVKRFFFKRMVKIGFTTGHLV
jgi:hypothetical protein